MAKIEQKVYSGLPSFYILSTGMGLYVNFFDLFEENASISLYNTFIINYRLVWLIAAKKLDKKCIIENYLPYARLG